MRLALPMSNAFMFVGNAAVRFEDRPNTSFDWFHTTMHDRGHLFRYDATLFVRGVRAAAIGPTVRINRYLQRTRRHPSWRAKARRSLPAS